MHRRLVLLLALSRGAADRPCRRRPGRQSEDRPRLGRRPGEQGLRRDLRRPDDRALPRQHADGQGPARPVLLRRHPPLAGQLPGDGQRPGLQPPDPGRLPGLHPGAARDDRPRRAGARHRLRLPGDGQDRRRPALGRAPRRWRAYLQDMGTPCRHPAMFARDDTQSAKKGDQYAARHNPFVYFRSVLDSGQCAQRDVPLDRPLRRPRQGVGHAELLARRARTCARTAMTPRASTAAPAACARPTASSRRGSRRSCARPPTRRTV